MSGGFVSDFNAYMHIVTTQNRDCLPTHLKYGGEGVFIR